MCDTVPLELLQSPAKGLASWVERAVPWASWRGSVLLPRDPSTAWDVGVVATASDASALLEDEVNLLHFFPFFLD